MLIYFLLWFPMILIAIANGIAREWYKKYTGEPAGRQISTIILILLFAVYIYWVVMQYPVHSDIQALKIGLLWMSLTLLFEFGFGLFRGNSWNQLLAEYNLIQGKLWILIPLWLLIAPYLLRKLS